MIKVGSLERAHIFSIFCPEIIHILRVIIDNRHNHVAGKGIQGVDIIQAPHKSPLLAYTCF
jgi:hypothetical protein